MTAFSDYFSETAARYALYRPRYPSELFAWISQHVSVRSVVWDCGTGSGQAAVPLSEYFDKVVATDPSASQVARAEPAENVHYSVMLAESAALRGRSVDAVTVAQAFHWFRHEAFYREVRRIVRPGGLIAVWSYSLCELGDEALDHAVRAFYTTVVGPFWPPERALVDAGYEGIEFPFSAIAPPLFQMEAIWTIEQFAGYLTTWSAVNRYRAAEGVDPVLPFVGEIAPLWGEPGTTRRVSWPVHVRAGVV